MYRFSSVLRKLNGNFVLTPTVKSGGVFKVNRIPIQVGKNRTDETHTHYNGTSSFVEDYN